MPQESQTTEQSHAVPPPSHDRVARALASFGAVAGFIAGTATLALVPPHSNGSASWAGMFLAAGVAGPVGALIGFALTPILFALAHRAARTVATLAIMATGTITGMVGGGIVGAHTMHTLHARVVGGSVGAIAALMLAIVGHFLPRRARA